MRQSALAFALFIGIVAGEPRLASAAEQSDSGKADSRRALAQLRAGAHAAKGKTSFFGLQAEGYKFAYVLDRSGSTGRPGRNALAAAKEQLISSLRNLEATQQFDLVFYNHEPVFFHPADQPGRLVYATEQNKTLAERFIHSIEADGGTDHEAALRLALSFQPDVLFLFTDADKPVLTPSQLEKLRDRAAGTIINTVEFGFGPRPEGESFLVRLARENGGQHVYVDIAQVGAK